GLTLTDFAEQPGILDSDDRLIGKGADEFNLPLGERLDPRARQHDISNGLTFAQQWHAEHGPCLALLGRHFRIARNGGYVMNMRGTGFADASRTDECGL